MIEIIAAPLGWIMRVLFEFTNSYGLTIILFAIITKILFLPLSIWVQKNSLKMVRLQPQVNEILARFASDKDKAAEEQLALYKREGYRPSLGVLPMLIQLPLIIGLINVVYNPLKHLLKIGDSISNLLLQTASSALGVEALGAAGQLQVAKMVCDPATSGIFSQIAQSNPEVHAAITQISTLNFNFLGIDLSATPSISEGGILLLVPILAGFSSLLLSVLQNRFNVLQREQGKFGQYGMAAFLTIFSLAFAFMVPAAIGVYWAIGNFAAIVVMFFINYLYPPKKYVDYEALEASKIALENARTLQKSAAPTREQKKLAKTDYKRFFDLDNEGKELVFYSVKNGFYRYYKDIIEQILEKSDIVIHYVTSDPNDEVFSMKSEQFNPYYIEGNNLIYFFMKLDADVVVMTMPEIENFHYKRSIVRKDIDYVYTFHAMVSTHMMYRPAAFDNYDTILCVGPHHIQEIKETEKIYNLKEKKLIEYGYPLLDDLRESYQKLEKQDDKFQILIAPSHHDGNIMDSCVEEILEKLSGNGYHIIVRPHPQYVKHNEARIGELKQKYTNSEEITFETDFSTNDSLYTSDVMITDWSGISLEYSFTTLRPCVFIETPMKVLNTDYKKIPLQPLEVGLRNKIGIPVEINDVEKLGDIITDIKNKKILTKEEIETIVEESVFNIGTHGTSGAEYIITEITKRRSSK